MAGFSPVRQLSILTPCDTLALMSNHPPIEGCTAPDEQLRRELQLLVQRHAEFSRRLETILAALESGHSAASAAPPQSASTGRELWLLNDRLSHAEEHLDALARQLEVTTGRLDEVVESRTWKLITGMGGILLKLTGRG